MADRDYKSTIRLPQTDFPMRASLGEREPITLARWKSERTYERALAARAGAPQFLFHDGPPYANGSLHYGHVLNKVLKDIVVKFQLIAGRDVRFVPGWDCHGLPIELGVEKANRGVTKVQLRAACRAEAEKWIDVQRKGFERLGVFGTWEAPYLTMDKGYERGIIEALAAFVREGLVYRGKKPVYWCGKDRTALAEAEVEYAPHTSPSIYVKFPVVGDDLAKLALIAGLAGVDAGAPTFALIWTTTPWTLPANLAIAVNPAHEYVLVDVGGERWLVARGLSTAVLAATKRTGEAVGNVLTGAQLEGIAARHPFEDRASPIFVGDHVTLEAGTGLVHTAPGHGADDYILGIQHGLPPFAPLDDAARFTNEVREEWRGKPVLEANPLIVKLLAETGRLANQEGESISHSYPHCWRCKSPVVFRATTQWFIALDEAMRDGKSLRTKALSEIDTIASGTRLPEKTSGWIPAWGRDRIHGMIHDRPDWCISRQRAWGVPIPSFHCKSCSEVIMTEATLAHVAELFAKEGADAWFLREAAELVPPGFACPKCGGTEFDKDSNILDVWFESGASFWSVMQKGAYGNTDGLPGRFVDLYLEGSDQHRGWFHSALLVGIALTGRAPYERVLTHGFVCDDQGRPYSKSDIRARREAGEKVEYVEPDTIIQKDGAEILRLWTAYEDYRNDVRYSKEHLAQVSDAYRKIRNTLRFLLGNLDAESATKASTLPFDRAVSAVVRRFESRVVDAYATYDFRLAYRHILQHCVDDLSAFCLDILKDRLYCGTPAERSSAQAALHLATTSLICAIAPVLSFTAEEAWGFVPGTTESVFVAGRLASRDAPGDAELLAAFGAAKELREVVNGQIEQHVAAKRFTNRAFADVAVQLPAASDVRKLLDAKAPDTLAEVLGVGRAVLTEGAELSVVVSATPLAFRQCARCRRVREDVTAEVCARCAGVLGEAS